MIDPTPDVPLGAHTTLQVGGTGRWGVTVESPEGLEPALRWAQTRDLPVLLLGGGSNMVVADEGFPGLVVRLGFSGVRRQAADGEVWLTVEAGHDWDALVAATVEADLAGLECLSGIPGQVGAAPIQNIGAYGQALEDTLVEVQAWDAMRQCLVTLDAAACAFGYRHSRFKADLLEHGPGRWIITAVTLRLRPGAPATLAYGELARRFAGSSHVSVAEARATVLDLRRGKSMVLDPNDPNSRSAGSFFTNPITGPAQVEAIARIVGEDPPQWPMSDAADRIKLSAAWLIERAGLHKGLRRGPVGLSARHTLAIVTSPGAKADDVACFAAGIRRRVHETFGIRLVPEPNFIGFPHDGDALLDAITPTSL
ncbi:MAG: UDP-N-acetylmuramate dehydrogenase [Bradymonadia bacterium]